MKTKRFFFHYNKPESQKLKKPQLSIHYNKACYIVDFIKCDIPIQSKNNKRQPFCVMTGKANSLIVEIDDFGNRIGILI